MSGAGTAVCGVAVAGSVVDFNSRLVVVAIHMEAHAVAPVLHGPGLHLHPLGHQIVAAENGGHPVQHMVAGLLYVIGHQVLKGQHTLGVQVAGAGDQIAGMLKKLGQDLRNPKNICPEDFMAAHDNATRKIAGFETLRDIFSL